MKKSAAQLDAEIAEALSGRRAGARPLYWEQRYVEAGDLRVGDVVLSGSVPPYTAYEVTAIGPAPRRRLRLALVRLPDRDHQRKSTLRPGDTVAVPAGSAHAKIGAAFSEREASSRSHLRPVEGLWIPADSRRALTAFWRAHPALRRGCLRKYGFDPIDAEEDYWRYGLAEPDHADVLRAVQQNGGAFTLALVKRWEAEELRHTRRGRTAHAAKRAIPDAVKTAIEARASDVIQGLYRRFETVGDKEPCVTVGLVADHLRQAPMPEDFRYATKEKQRTWTRSVLESMRRRGVIGSSFGARARCYEPKR
jgi:hypothetical protein